MAGYRDARKERTPAGRGAAAARRWQGWFQAIQNAIEPL